MHVQFILFQPAQRIYCGFQNAIEVFDLNYPGEGERIHTTPTKKSRSGVKGMDAQDIDMKTMYAKNNNEGIISSLAFSPDYSGLYAAGTFSSYLVLYDENSPGQIIQHMEGVEGPITQVNEVILWKFMSFTLHHFDR